MITSRYPLIQTWAGHHLVYNLRFFWDKKYVDSSVEEPKVEDIIAGKYIPPRRVVHIGKYRFYSIYKI